MKNETATNEAPPASDPQYVTLKNAIAPKLGKHADGTISYKVACDAGRTVLFLAITDNSSGGYFSREYVPVACIEELLANPDQSGFPSKVLKAAFTGKSSNNAGFLAAILHAEELLSRTADSETKHVCTGHWAKWKGSALALEGTPDETSSPPAQSADVPHSPGNNKATTAKPHKPLNPTNALIRRWGGCAVTGCRLTELCVASHLKPWSRCESRRERLTVANGLLLIPTLDKLLDRGLITFDQRFRIKISPYLPVGIALQLNINPNLTLQRPHHPDMLPYLHWHEKNVFRDKPIV